MEISPSPPVAHTRHSAWLPAIALLLALLVALAAYHEYQRATVAAAVARQVQMYEDLSAALETDYKQAAYDDPDLNGIMQQQFRALEFIMQYQRLLVEQNNTLLTLLAEGM